MRCCLAGHRHHLNFNSPYISICNHFPQIRAADVAKLVSRSWKALSTEERFKWDELARFDRERYEREKATYRGPWKVPDIKDPKAPKKPMSAFLAFGNERRKAIAAANPALTNSEISSLLSQLWKDYPAQLKTMYRDREIKERGAYKKRSTQWKQQRERIFADMVTSKTMLNDNLDDSSQSCSRTSNLPGRMSLEDSRFAMDAQFLLKGDFSSTEDDNSYGTQGSGLFGHDTMANVQPHQPPSSAQFDIVERYDGRISSGQGGQTIRDFHPNALAAEELPPVRIALGRYDVDRYSIEELLEDEELFEDFSPSDVPAPRSPLENKKMHAMEARIAEQDAPKSCLDFLANGWDLDEI